MGRGKESSEPSGLLGVGELSTILLGKELHANAVLFDDYKARKLATAKGLQVCGSVGLLETFYLRGYLTDLRLPFGNSSRTAISTGGC
jgi:predicted nucleic acid-binding protein